MRPIRISVGVLADDADGICASQAPAGAGALTINGALASGGVVSLSAAQIVSVTSSGNDSVNAFTITGTDACGVVISETITGPNANTVDTTNHFKTVTAVAIDGAAVGNITVGVEAANGTSTAAIPISHQVPEFNLGVNFELTAGTMTITGYYTMDDPEGTYTNSFLVDAMWTAITAVSAKSASASGNHTIPSTAVKFVQTTGSTTGTCKYTLLQASR